MKRVFSRTSFGLFPRTIFVIGIFLQMQKPQPLCLFDIRLPLFLRQHFPSSAEALGDLGIVHVWRHLNDLPPLDLRPHHEGIHGPLDMVGGLLTLSGVGVRRGGGGIDLIGTEFA